MESSQQNMRSRNYLGVKEGQKGHSNSPSLHGFLQDYICCSALLQHWPCEPNWLRRGWPGARSMAPGSWEEQRGRVSVSRGETWGSRGNRDGQMKITWEFERRVVTYSCLLQRCLHLQETSGKWFIIEDEQEFSSFYLLLQVGPSKEGLNMWWTQTVSSLPPDLSAQTHRGTDFYKLSVQQPERHDQKDCISCHNSSPQITRSLATFSGFMLTFC